MTEYGVTEKGFVLKRMDTILEEIQVVQSEGFGFDVRQNPQSFLNVLNLTFANQMAELWETAQNSYFAKYPSTAEGLNLDNANQYGGIRRAKNLQSFYPLHCSGDDGTYIRKGAVVASNTMPKVKLLATTEFYITRDNFNCTKIRVAVNESGIYSVNINGNQYSYSHQKGDNISIIRGLVSSIQNEEYQITVEEENALLVIQDKTVARNNALILTENLTTAEVTTIASFGTEQYGKIILANNTVTEIITAIGGFMRVDNCLEPRYGRLEETDIEFRHSYLAKSAIRSSRMINSITSQLLNNVINVESAAGYENETDVVDSEGRPPHSIEIVVEGGNEMEIAQTILDKKAGGISTFGNIVVSLTGTFGDIIPIRFNRPSYIHAWIKIKLYGNKSILPANFSNLTIDAIMREAQKLKAGDYFISQLLHEGIYDTVAGLTYIDIKIAASRDSSYIPKSEEYTLVNIEATSREKVMVKETRIEVVFNEPT